MRTITWMWLLALISVFSIGLAPTVSALPQSSSGQVAVDGILAGPPPNTPPTIEEPSPNSTFSDKNIVIKGTCISDLIVRMYRNNIFAGSVQCQANGRYELAVDLFIGQNDLFAKQFDSLNQSSPSSATVTFFHIISTVPLPNTLPPSSPTTQPPAQPATGTAQFQLIIEYDYTLQAIFTGKPFTLPISFGGGNPPYAVNIDWGDGKNSTFVRQNTDRFSIEHVFEKPGYVTVTITISDNNGETARLSFVLLVSGEDEQSPLIRAVTGQAGVGWQLAIGGIIILSLAGAFFAGIKTSTIRRRKV